MQSNALLKAAVRARALRAARHLRLAGDVAATPCCWAGSRVGTREEKSEIHSLIFLVLLFTQKPLFFQQTKRGRYCLNEHSHPSGLND